MLLTHAAKPAVKKPVIIEALVGNVGAEVQSIASNITEEISAQQLVYWELGVIAIVPVSNMYKVFAITPVCPERTLTSVLNNLHNRGMFSMINAKGSDGSTRMTVANLRSWRNKITVDKLLAGSVNLFISGNVRNAIAATLFAMSIVDIGGSACVHVGNINTTALACAIHAFASHFTARIHRVCNGDIYLIGTNKTKTLRAESIFTMVSEAIVNPDTALFDADYLRSDEFTTALATMTASHTVSTVEQWKHAYKYEYLPLHV